MIAYLEFGLVALLPAVFCFFFHLLSKYTKYKDLKPIVKEIIAGIVFGGLAVLGTEKGIPMNGAQVNCRDAAVLVAGFFFGWRAGIIAGVIGGVERWFAVYWGISSFTRVACSVSTIIAGLFSAYIRKILLKDKKPNWPLSFVLAAIMETFHMIMVFVTNMDDPDRAFNVVKVCSVVMISGNAASVLVSAIVIVGLNKEKLFREHLTPKITRVIQNLLLITSLLALFLSILFFYNFYTLLGRSSAKSELDTVCVDLVNDVSTESNNKITQTLQEIKDAYGTKTLSELKEEYDVSEINIVNEDGMILYSSEGTLYEGTNSNAKSTFKPFEGYYVTEYGPTTRDSSIYRKYAGMALPSGTIDFSSTQYYLQIGNDYSKFSSGIYSLINGATENRRVGKTGFSVVLDKDYIVVDIPENKSNHTSISLDGNKEKEIFEITFDGNIYFGYYVKAEGYYIAAFITKSEAYNTRDISLYANLFLEVVIFSIIFFQVYALLKRKLVSKINVINDSLGQITNGNLETVVPEFGVRELDELGTDINITVDSLKDHIEEANRRIDAELALAKDIQKSVLPVVNDQIENHTDFDIAPFMDTAKEVGGDFYDFYLTDNNTLNILIADVSGKGIPAAMFMMRAKAQLKSLTESGNTLDEVFNKANKALCEGNDAMMFVTAWQAKIDLHSGHVEYVNAGHNPPLIRKDGKYEYLKGKTGFVLGGMDMSVYKINEFDLNETDGLYLYTDGVTEATSLEKELYGEDRLLEFVNSHKFYSMKDMNDQIMNDVNAFVGEAPQADDITMLSFKYTPKLNVGIEIENAQISDITRITEFCEGILERLDASPKATIQINIAIDEIVSNIINHGYKGQGGYVLTRIKESSDSSFVELSFIDKGIPYNPITAEDPDTTLEAEKRSIGGLGIFMVKKSMDDMRYKYENGKNVLTIKKVIK